MAVHHPQAVDRQICQSFVGHIAPNALHAEMSAAPPSRIGPIYDGTMSRLRRYRVQGETSAPLGHTTVPASRSTLSRLNSA